MGSGISLRGSVLMRRCSGLGKNPGTRGRRMSTEIIARDVHRLNSRGDEGTQIIQGKVGRHENGIRYSVAGTREALTPDPGRKTSVSWTRQPTIAESVSGTGEPPATSGQQQICRECVWQAVERTLPFCKQRRALPSGLHSIGNRSQYRAVIVRNRSRITF